MSSMLKVKSGTKYRKIAADEPLNLVVDIGNGYVKAMISGHFGEEITFPHRVAKLAENKYAGVERSAKVSNATYKGSAIFRDKEGQGYVVGQMAVGMSEGKRIAGAEKYTRDHYGMLLLAAMLQLYPDGHQNVQLVVLHPTNINTANFEAMIDSLRGTHTAQLPNGTVAKYKVKAITPIEEPVAGLQTFILNTRGNDYKRPGIDIRPNRKILVLDIGYELTSMVPVLINRDMELEVNIGQARVINVGINNVAEALDTLLKNSFSKLSNKSDFLEDMVMQAIRDYEIEISGDPHKVADDGRTVAELVDDAMYPLASQVQTFYKNDYAEGVGYLAIVVSGGGGAGSFNYMYDRVLNHGHVLPAEDDLDYMQVGGVRGGAKGQIAFFGLKAQEES